MSEADSGLNAASPATGVASSSEDLTDVGSSTARGSSTTIPRTPTLGSGEFQSLGPYRVLQELGRGGMGAVFLAVDTRLDRPLALKVMLPEYAAKPVARERFLREARATARIMHDNIVTVFEADERDGMPYIAMQLLEGCPLDAYLKQGRRLTLPQLLRVAHETAAGLAAAHRTLLVHRDIKPGNLWLEVPQGRVKILDFGLAKPVDADIEITKSGAIVGTPAFMSPEQGQGLKVDHRSDLFSLGAVLYLLTTGRLPFQRPNVMAVLMALGNDDPTPVLDLNPEAPAALATLIHKLLSKRPEHRPASADEVARSLLEIASSLPDSHLSGIVMEAVQVASHSAVWATQPFSNLSADAAMTTAAAESLEPRGTWQASQTALADSPPRAGWRKVATAWLLTFAVLAAVVVVVIENRDGSRTRLEVPSGAAVSIREQQGETVVDVHPRGAEPTGEVQAAPASTSAASIESTLPPVGLPRAPTWPFADLPFAKSRDNDLPFFDLKPGPMKAADSPPAPAADVDLAAARYILEVGGRVRFFEYPELITGANQVLPIEASTLEVVWLRGNQEVTDEGLAIMRGVQYVTHLDLVGTPVTDVGLAHFKGCQRLEIFDVVGAPIGDAGVAHFRGLKGLVSLWLGSTKVTDVGLAAFQDCKYLNHLDLTSTRVTDKGLAHFQGCHYLTGLYLGNTKITDAGLAIFSNSPRLKEIFLHDTAVTDAGFAPFFACPALTKVDLRGTQVTRATIEKLRRLYPQCEVQWESE